MDAKEKVSSGVLGTSPVRRWLGTSSPARSRLTPGAELARKLGEGVLRRAPTQYVSEVRERVTEACGELIGIGARIRPLLSDGRVIGWVRALHDTERRLLRRWFPDKVDFVLRCFLLTTTLSEEEVSSLSSSEVARLVRLVIAMGDRDASLYPYLSAFSTTRESECLWHSGGGGYASFENKFVLMPDGKRMTILCPSDHARLWASLCTYREQSKKRLDESWNAVLIMRPWAGRSVDGLAAELREATKQMQAGIPEPWESVVSAPPDKSLDDGWAHLENMETTEGMLKELDGMLGNDRHERLMQEFERQQLEAAERRRREIERMAMRHGGPGIGKEVIQVLTDEDTRRQEAAIRAGRTAVPPPSPREQEAVADIAEKLRKYR